MYMVSISIVYKILIKTLWLSSSGSSINPSENLLSLDCNVICIWRMYTIQK
ncbi:hypothetical protein MANES_07G071856v8 [Manihot esculenta]|uniref:Uncharacterized protein n=1 Tax=Manihot esculenta TaxID=3983 RepID=A0ACB7HE20_MANES|nr:hypothetical protein MANES_07G071856v8 [Manihot esculenta]